MGIYIGELAGVAYDANKKEARGKEKSVGGPTGTSSAYKPIKIVVTSFVKFNFRNGHTASFYTKKSRSKLETTLFDRLNPSAEA
ncbi:hypothetical protein [Lysinibacillus mangiferihumi]|uniref:hypothetical protein n=1 Tax=Lysinibacillus mangiferihumi TaxID=1130819 RepID=UPI000D3B737D|nr:hypothetical protein [Lysinibacillus mangiferihumi]